MNDHKPLYSREELLALLEHVQYQAKEETKIKVAECMLDYGIDQKLVRTITGLKPEQLVSRQEY